MDSLKFVLQKEAKDQLYQALIIQSWYKGP
jgi:hypothetical protein